MLACYTQCTPARCLSLPCSESPEHKMTLELSHHPITILDSSADRRPVGQLATLFGVLALYTCPTGTLSCVYERFVDLYIYALMLQVVDDYITPCVINQCLFNSNVGCKGINLAHFRTLN